MGTFLLQCRQGDTKKVVLTWKDSNGDLVDMTGYTFQFKVQNGLSENTYTGSPEVDASVASVGQVTLTLSAAQTAAFTVNNGEYSFKVTAPNTDATTLLSGGLNVDLV
jgi:hypothetical protein